MEQSIEQRPVDPFTLYEDEDVLQLWNELWTKPKKNYNGYSFREYADLLHSELDYRNLEVDDMLYVTFSMTTKEGLSN